MPVNNERQIESGIIGLIRDVTGRQSVHLEEMIGQDIGVHGSDGILLVEMVEDRFDLDLSPLIDANTKFLPPTWWDRLRGRTHGPPVADVKVRELVEYVMQHKGEGKRLVPRLL